MAKGTSPTARSMKQLREDGFIVAKVEQKIHMPSAPFPLTRDCFGFGDLLIARAGFGTALIQVTATGDMNRRFRKIKGYRRSEAPERGEMPAAKMRLSHRLNLAIESSCMDETKRGPRGKQKRWELVERKILKWRI